VFVVQKRGTEAEGVDFSILTDLNVAHHNTDVCVEAEIAAYGSPPAVYGDQSDAL